jgi:hypothetical protein
MGTAAVAGVLSGVYQSYCRAPRQRWSVSLWLRKAKVVVCLGSDVLDQITGSLAFGDTRDQMLDVAMRRRQLCSTVRQVVSTLAFKLKFPLDIATLPVHVPNSGCR